MGNFIRRPQQNSLRTSSGISEFSGITMLMNLILWFFLEFLARFLPLLLRDLLSIVFWIPPRIILIFQSEINPTSCSEMSQLFSRYLPKFLQCSVLLYFAWFGKRVRSSVGKTVREFPVRNFICYPSISELGKNSRNSYWKKSTQEKIQGKLWIEPRKSSWEKIYDKSWKKHFVSNTRTPINESTQRMSNFHVAKVKTKDLTHICLDPRSTRKCCSSITQTSMNRCVKVSRACVHRV